MLCAISGEAPREAVASRKSGNVFEKRLIEAHIAEHHTDPVSGEDLVVEDLIELKSPQIVNPRPPNLTSIPALLGAFQNEWDAIVLETYTLKQQLAQTRQELSTALYQNDAATRVVARLTRERNEAREALSNVTISKAATSNGDAMQVDGQALPAELVSKVEATQQQLFATRRKRPIPDSWATADDISSFDVHSSTDIFYPRSRDISVHGSGDLVLFGGADAVAGVYTVSQAKLLHTLKAGSAVTATTWWGDLAVVATSAGTIKIFEQGNEHAQVGQHAGAVISIALHPCQQILASIGADKHFALYDLSTFKIVSRVYVEAELTCCSFHVDGLLFFVGSADGMIRIYDVKTGDAMAELKTSAPVLDISFSENGTWFAVVNQDSGDVSIWDIRKQNVVKMLNMGSHVERVKWDYTGQYLAIAGTAGLSVHQYTKASKSWNELLRKAVPSKDVAWGADASSLVVLTPEGSLSILSVS